MREKLIEILRVPIYPHELVDPIEAVADYLLDNDVVPVVRCKDCKHWVEADDGSWQKIGRTDGACRWLAEQRYAERYMTECEHFCSYGERRTDDRETG